MKYRVQKFKVHTYGAYRCWICEKRKNKNQYTYVIWRKTPPPSDFVAYACSESCVNMIILGDM